MCKEVLHKVKHLYWYVSYMMAQKWFLTNAQNTMISLSYMLQQSCGNCYVWRMLLAPRMKDHKSDMRGGTQKFPELLKKIYSKYLYKFETLVPFKVLPLWLDAAMPALLPMLETLSKIFKGNAVKGRWRFSLNLSNVSKLPSLQILLHPW